MSTLKTRTPEENGKHVRVSTDLLNNYSSNDDKEYINLLINELNLTKMAIDISNSNLSKINEKFEDFINEINYLKNENIELQNKKCFICNN